MPGMSESPSPAAVPVCLPRLDLSGSLRKAHRNLKFAISSGGGSEGTSNATRAFVPGLSELPPQNKVDENADNPVEVIPGPSASRSTPSDLRRLTPRPGKFPEDHHATPNTPTSTLSPYSCPTPAQARSPESLFPSLPPSPFERRGLGDREVVSHFLPALRPTRSRKPAPPVLAPLRLPPVVTGAAVPSLSQSPVWQTSAPAAAAAAAALVPSPTPSTTLRRSTLVSAPQWALHKTTTADPLLACPYFPAQSGSAMVKAATAKASPVRSRSAPPRLVAAPPPSRSTAVAHRLAGVLVSKVRIHRVLPGQGFRAPGSVTRISRLVASPSMPLLVRWPSAAP
eukprot:RCo023882